MDASPLIDINQEKVSIENLVQSRTLIPNQEFNTYRPEYFLPIKEIAEMLSLSKATIHTDLNNSRLMDFCIKKHGKVCVPSYVVRELFKNRGFPYSQQVLTFQILKGGAGKSTCSYGIGRRLAQRGYRVLHVDIDPQSNSSSSILMEAARENRELIKSGEVKDRYQPDVKEKIKFLESQTHHSLFDYFSEGLNLEDIIIPVTEHMHLIPSNMSNAGLDAFFKEGKFRGKRFEDEYEILQEFVEALKDHYEIIIFDCPPTLEVPVLGTALISDQVVLPVFAANYCFQGLDQSNDAIDSLVSSLDGKYSVKKRVLFNLFAGKAIDQRKLSSLFTNEKYSEITLDSVIRYHDEIPDRIDLYSDFFDYTDIKAKEVPDLVRDFDSAALKLVGGEELLQFLLD